MLSLEDVRNVSFRKAKFGGYKPEDVDAFIDDLQISYEEILKERKEMTEKIKKMKSFLDKFQAEDVSIKDVILNAKNIAEKSLSDAELESKDMIAKATESSKKMIEDAKKEVSVQNEIAQRIKSESSKIKEKLADIYKSHMELIKNIPSEVERAFSEEEKQTKVCEEPKLTPEEKVNKIMNAVSVDIFSEPSMDEVGGGVSDSVNEKFKNLEFGKNYDPTSANNQESEGLYNGALKK
ncbi:MAG: DivIVA domain-containing protein [Clostridia bacterium]|nr:DivIVA domain-containing protein [Clostridia bacterium]MBR2734653.1 DivIVA domain-containing protein [Clostridia bacterium]